VSRHALKALDPRNEVTIGWDPPLRTYFVQVFQPVPHVWVARSRKRAICMHCDVKRDAPATAPSAMDAQVCPAVDSTELLWRGFGVGMHDVLTLEAAEKLLEPYAVVPPLMHAQLLQDERWNR
jgi:hypothetical protein